MTEDSVQKQRKPELGSTNVKQIEPGCGKIIVSLGMNISSLIILAPMPFSSS